MDEIDFALEVIERTGKTFLAVNMFTDSDERIVNAAKSCTARLRSEGNRTKLDDEIYLVNSKQAFEGYRLNDANKVRQSGIQKLERRLAAFIINGAYLAKVRSAVDGAVTLVSVLKEELSRVRVALIADQKEFISALDSCDANLREINNRRDRVEKILQRTIRRAVSDAVDSYRVMWRDLESSIELKFEQCTITSLSTTQGKLTALVTKKASREANEILNKIIENHVQEWAEPKQSERGLPHDLMAALDEGRHDLDEQYKGIDALLQDISVKIGKFDLEKGEPASTVSLGDRLASAGVGYLLFGPLAIPLNAAGGWRSVFGGVLGVAAANFALTFIATAFGVVLGPVAIAALVTAAAVTGGGAAALLVIEKRIRERALAEVSAKLKALLNDETSIDGFKTNVREHLEREANEVLEALDAVLSQERESFFALRAANNASLEQKAARLTDVSVAEFTLNAATRHLADIVESASLETNSAA